VNQYAPGRKAFLRGELEKFRVSKGTLEAAVA
jgi:hypothetical protein